MTLRGPGQLRWTGGARQAWCAPLIVLLAVAAPFWAVEYLPLLDLPQHLALSSVVARHGDPATGFASYYLIDWRLTPYWGYYAAMHLFGAFLPIELANRILLTLYAIGLPLSIGFALASFGRDWRWAAISLPLVYNTNLFYGFMSFALSLPLFFLALGLTASYLAAWSPTRGLAWRTAAAAALVYLFHAQTYLLLGLCVAVLFAIHWQGARWAGSRAVPYLLSLALFAPWFARSFIWPEAPLLETHTANHQNYGGVGNLALKFEPLATVLGKIPERLWAAYNDGSDHRIGYAWLALLALTCLAAGFRSSASLRAFMLERRGELVALALFAAYLFAPMEMAGQWYINPRHLVFAALLLPVFIDAPAAGWRRSLLLVAVALGLFSSVTVTEKLRAFQSEVGPFGEVVERMEPGKRVMNLIFDNGANGTIRWWPFVHWSCYYQARKGGDVSFSFAGLPSIPITYRPGMQAPHTNEWSPQDFRWATMGSFYDYFLIRGRPHGDAAALAQWADLVIETPAGNGAQAWQLWKKRGF